VDGILYCNDGDWVESLTALVELENGELKIVAAVWGTRHIRHRGQNTARSRMCSVPSKNPSWKEEALRILLVTDAWARR